MSTTRILLLNEDGSVTKEHLFATLGSSLCPKTMKQCHHGGPLQKEIAAHIDAGDSQGCCQLVLCVHESCLQGEEQVQITKDFTDCPQTGRPHTACLKGNISAVKAKIEASPCNNIPNIAREFNVDKNAVSRIVQHDLGLKSRACSKVQGLRARQREKGLSSARKF